MRMFLVPGFSQTAGAWSEVIAALPLRSDVVALDVPPAASFAATVDALGDAGAPGCWVGYSMGARLALALALARPELVRRLVLVSGGVGIDDEHERHARAAADDALAERAQQIGVDAFLDEWLAQPLFAGVPDTARGHRLTDADALAHQLRVLGSGRMPPLRARLATIEVPVLLVTGTRDEKYDAIAVDAAARIADVTHLRVEGGHALLHDAPEAVAAAITAFTR